MKTLNDYLLGGGNHINNAYAHDSQGKVVNGTEKQ